MDKDNTVTEYVITYKDCKPEFITEDKEESQEEFEKSNKKNVNQYFSKDWNMIDGEYQEGYVEVFYNNLF